MSPGNMGNADWVAQKAPPSGSESAARPKQRLLVVDDESSMCDVLVAYFEHLGLEVKVARTAAQGSQLIEEGQFDLAVFDWKLDDGTSGLDLLSRSKEKHPERPVIMFTGADDDEYLIKKAVAGQAEAVVRKTASLSALATQVFLRLGGQRNG